MSADVPRPAPELTFPLPNGQKISLSSYKGKVVVVEILLTTCPHCQVASQLLDKLYKEYGPRGFQPLGIATNEMAQLYVPDYVKKYNLSFPVGYASRDTALAFLQHPVMLTMYVPQLVFIDRKGVIRGQYSGTDPFFQNEEKNMRAMIESLLNEPATADAGKKATPAPSSKKK